MVGIDTVEVARIDKSEKFLDKIANKNEIEYINLTKNKDLKLQKTAALFCVKEATMKALGLGANSGVVFKDITLLHEDSGKPYVVLSGKAKDRFDEQFKGKKIEVSLSHTNLVATAICIIV